MIRARPVFGQSIQEKHEEVMQALARVEGPWGLAGKSTPPAPDPGEGLIAQVKLTGLFGRGVRGHVLYRFRGPAEDAGMYDDFLLLEFNPKSVDYRSLVSVFDEYVHAFQAYRGHIGDAPDDLAELEAARRVELRRAVYPIYPVTFFDDELSRRAFGLTASEVVERLNGKVKRASLVAGGALLVGRDDPVPREEAAELDARIRSQLSVDLN